MKRTLAKVVALLATTLLCSCGENNNSVLSSSSTNPSLSDSAISDNTLPSFAISSKVMNGVMQVNQSRGIEDFIYFTGITKDDLSITLDDPTIVQYNDGIFKALQPGDCTVLIEHYLLPGISTQSFHLYVFEENIYDSTYSDNFIDEGKESGIDITFKPNSDKTFSINVKAGSATLDDKLISFKTDLNITGNYTIASSYEAGLKLTYTLDGKEYTPAVRIDLFENNTIIANLPLPVTITTDGTQEASTYKFKLQLQKAK